MEPAETLVFKYCAVTLILETQNTQMHLAMCSRLTMALSSRFVTPCANKQNTWQSYK